MHETMGVEELASCAVEFRIVSGILVVVAKPQLGLFTHVLDVVSSTGGSTVAEVRPPILGNERQLLPLDLEILSLPFGMMPEGQINCSVTNPGIWHREIGPAREPFRVTLHRVSESDWREPPCNTGMIVRGRHSKPVPSH